MTTVRTLVGAGLGALWLVGTLHVRPVAADAPPGRFTVTATEVYDTKTKLTWQRTLTGGIVNFANAGSYCAGLGSGYRLPSLNELQTIVDDSRANPSIDPVAFPSAPVATFWSSSLVAGNPSNAWFVDFSYGDTNTSFPVTANSNFRCVR